MYTISAWILSICMEMGMTASQVETLFIGLDLVMWSLFLIGILFIIKRVLFRNKEEVVIEGFGKKILISLMSLTAKLAVVMGLFLLMITVLMAWVTIELSTMGYDNVALVNGIITILFGIAMIEAFVISAGSNIGTMILKMFFGKRQRLMKIHQPLS